MAGHSLPLRTPPVPQRLRRIEPGFAFIPNRFLHHGFFASLSHAERSLYLFLVLAGDRNGVSFYALDRICSILEMPLDDLLAVRNSLIDKDLIAFDGTRFQVLSLPPSPAIAQTRPLVTVRDFEEQDPATVGHILRSSLQRRR
jgi:hypothetical protein